MYQFSLACAQIERQAGEGAPSESFFLIKDGIEEVAVSFPFVCGISSIPPRSPLRAGEPLSAFCFTSSAEFTRGSGPAPPMLHSLQYLLHRKALWKHLVLKDWVEEKGGIWQLSALILHLCF